MTDSADEGTRTPARGYHEKPSVIQLHRVIGGYITTFSELIKLLRTGISEFMSDPAEEKPLPNPLLDVLFATMTAKPIADAYFGMATAVGKYDESDKAMRGDLRRRVAKHIQFRNDLAHSDWEVRWMYADTEEPVPPAAYKMRSVDGIPQLQRLDINTNEIVRNINDLQELSGLIRAFTLMTRWRQAGKGVGPGFIPTLLKIVEDYKQEHGIRDLSSIPDAGTAGQEERPS